MFSGLSFAVCVALALTRLASRSCCCNRLFSSSSFLSPRSFPQRLLRLSRPRDPLRPRLEFQPSLSCDQRPRAMGAPWRPGGEPPPPWCTASKSRLWATAMMARALCRALRARRCHDGSVVSRVRTRHEGGREDQVGRQGRGGRGEGANAELKARPAENRSPHRPFADPDCEIATSSNPAEME